MYLAVSIIDLFNTLAVSLYFILCIGCCTCARSNIPVIVSNWYGPMLSKKPTRMSPNKIDFWDWAGVKSQTSCKQFAHWTCLSIESLLRRWFLVNCNAVRLQSLADTYSSNSVNSHHFGRLSVSSALAVLFHNMKMVKFLSGSFCHLFPGVSLHYSF